jgi:hypothetical protein
MNLCTESTDCRYTLFLRISNKPRYIHSNCKKDILDIASNLGKLGDVWVLDRKYQDDNNGVIYQNF